MYLSSNNGNSWDSINNGLPIGAWIKSLAIRGDTIFAAEKSCMGIYLSTNNGQHWTAVNAGLTGGGLYALALTRSGNNIFAGTGGGVFLSTNNGNSWTAINTGLTGDALSVNALAINGDTLFAGTNNSGVWKCSISQMLGIKEINNASTVTVYPNPATDNITIETPQTAVIEITNIQGQLIKTFNATANKTNIDVSALPGGVYVVEVRTEKGVEVRKFIKE